jgi:predicted nucleic acid-binding protein
MKSRSFLDTNVWIYAATGKFSAPAKHGIARRLLASEIVAVSGQVIGEFVVNVTNAKKMKAPLPASEVAEWLEIMDRFEFVEIDKLIVSAALIGVKRHRIHYWDSALLAQAERFGAETFYTEDLNHDQMYGTVRARNPFRVD